MCIEDLRIRRTEHLIDGIYVHETSLADLAAPRPALLFVHGAYQGSWVFRQWQSFFAACGWRTFALSLRNHPGSYRLSEREFLQLTPADYVSDVLHIATWIQKPFVLVGHSMGGMIAQKAAESCPGYISALVLLGSGPPASIGASRPRDMPSDRVSIPDYEQVRRHMFGKMNDAEYAAFFARLVPETPSVLNQTGRGRISIDPKNLSMPVLAVDGERDRNRYGPRFAEFYGGEYIVVPEAYHALMMCRWGLSVADAVQQWLAAKTPDFQYAQRPTWHRPA